MQSSTTIREALFIKSLSLIPKHEKIELLSYLTQLESKQLYFHLEDKLTETLHKEYLQLAEKLLAGHPLQYLTSRAYFYGLDFYVDANVLIPRPETEVMVDYVITNHVDSKHILDLGTGSAAIAVALAHNLPEAEITAVDICSQALEVARQNAQAYKNINLLESDLLTNVSNTQFDVICANLPYIGTHKFSGVDSNVSKFEPKKALFAGEDGLDLYRRLFVQIHNKGIQFKELIIELADRQYSTAYKLAHSLFPNCQLQAMNDLNGTKRFLKIKSQS